MASIKEVNSYINKLYVRKYVIVFKFVGLYVLKRFLVQFSEMEIIFQISYDIDDLLCVINSFFVGYFIYGLSYYYAKLSLFFRLS